MATPLTLPTVEQIDAVDEKLSSAVSDLDAFASMVARIEPETSPEEALRIFREDLPFPEPPEFQFDAGSFSRLLVFAADAASDAETLREYASNLEDGLLQLYRSRVLESAVAAVKS